MNANPQMCEACGRDPATGSYPIGGGVARDAEEREDEGDSPIAAIPAANASRYCEACEPCAVCGAHGCSSRRCAYNDEDRDEGRS